MLDPGCESRIKGIYQKRGIGAYRDKRLGDMPAAEVYMNSAESALALRRSFSRKKKEGIEFYDIFLANIVTVATSVRSAIMQAMAKKFATPNQFMAVRPFVLGFRYCQSDLQLMFTKEIHKQIT